MSRPTGTEEIPPGLWRRIVRALGCDPMGYPIDPYSALIRPGAWEWATPGAHGARRMLDDAGFRATIAPSAPWRVQWRRREVKP